MKSEEIPSYTREEMRRMNRIEAVILFAIVTAFFAVMAVIEYCQPSIERLAYLEGYVLGTTAQHPDSN